MLIIRTDQMKVFDEQRDVRLADLLHAHLEQRYPDWIAPLSEEEIRDRVRRAIRVARQYGLDNVRTIGEFVARTFTAGPLFFKQPNIAAALASVSSDPDPDTRFALLDLMLTARDWNEARQSAGPFAAPHKEELP
ncbi:hypothetical protein ASC94_01640 [Massilia sp. Root418]|uniref:hypothetical protein n=1 Tax=Massilia sp. Root418 TaxID=1736532 RepID=UPI0006F916CE|nr:hypothetical protein [Massilia sp. Root418]KQX01364.1 hypothetical protein ASC94_01640 [Massilia sp. Root418]